MKRYGSIIRLDQKNLTEYKELHAAVWPHVLKRIASANIQNYTIFYRDGFLFGYFEYTGSDFERDMELMAMDETIESWWSICKPLQQPLVSRDCNEWWATMEEVFHTD